MSAPKVRAMQAIVVGVTKKVRGSPKPAGFIQWVLLSLIEHG